MPCREQHLHTVFSHHPCRVPGAGAKLAGSFPRAAVRTAGSPNAISKARRLQMLFFKTTLYVG